MTVSHLPWIHVLAIRIGAGSRCKVQLGRKSGSVLQGARGPGPILPGILGRMSGGLRVIVLVWSLVAVEGERLGVQFQWDPYNSVLPKEGAAAVCWWAARLRAQRRVSLTGGWWRRIQRRLLCIETRVVVVRCVNPVKRLTKWTPIPTLLQGSWWRSFSLRQQGLGVNGLGKWLGKSTKTENINHWLYCGRKTKKIKIANRRHATWMCVAHSIRDNELRWQITFLSLSLWCLSHPLGQKPCLC